MSQSTPSPSSSTNQQTADLVRDAATGEIAAILQRLNTSANGLSGDDAAERLAIYGPNEVGQEKSTTGCGGSGWPCAIRWWFC